jgi:hypothetical protein
MNINGKTRKELRKAIKRNHVRSAKTLPIGEVVSLITSSPTPIKLKENANESN